VLAREHREIPGRKERGERRNGERAGEARDGDEMPRRGGGLAKREEGDCGDDQSAVVLPATSST